MRAAVTALALVLAGAIPVEAHAGASRCWVDSGAVVVPAAFGRITGDFLLDLSTAHSVLHLDVAQGDGIQTTSASGVLIFAGERIPAQLAVASLDDRSLGLPTTINGLVGADVLASYVIDLRLSPCRIALWPRRAPSFHATATAPIQWVEGVPTIAASISDGRTALAGRFAIDTGTNAVRVSSAAGALSRTPKGIDPASRLDPPARLDAVGFGGKALRGLPSALESDLPSGVLGGLGDAVWSRYDVRIDLKRARLELRPRAAH
jgi:hypothetical protein